MPTTIASNMLSHSVNKSTVLSPVVFNGSIATIGVYKPQSYDDPSILTTMHWHEQTIYLQSINNKKDKKVTYLHIYKVENCLDVVGLDL